MTPLKRHRSCLFMAALMMTACSQGVPHENMSVRSRPEEWASYNGDYAETRHSSLTQVTPGNVGKLGLVWSFDFDNDRAQESTPLVVDRVMYVTSAWSKLYALDGATGKELWRFDPQVPGKFQLTACCDVVNRGVAYTNGKLFLGTIDGRLIAIDAKTGKQLWSVVTVDQAQPYSITGAPRAAKGKIFIGNGGAEYGVRGYVSAYDEDSGKLIWRFYTVPGEPGKKDGAASDAILAKLAKPTWFGNDYWKLGGGGTVWDSIVYDPELDQIYIGVGNGAPWDHLRRSAGKGDNLFLGSVVALNPDTGAYLWHYQETPGDSWDFTSTQQMSLAALMIGGADRKVILHAPKNGFFYVIDRTNGKLISADKYVDANWADHIDMKTGRPVENPDARYLDKPFLATTGSAGGHNWHPMTYDPKSGLVYLPAQQLPQLYVRDKNFVRHVGLWALGVDTNAAPFPQTPEQIAQAKASMQGMLLAWDPVARKPVWEISHGAPWNGGLFSTATGLVFQGLHDGSFRAYAANSGKELWTFDAQNSIVAGGMSFAISGTQYVAIAVGGANGTPALPRFDGPLVHPPGRVLVFKLGGKAALPHVEGAVQPLNPGAGAWSSTQVAHGQKLFGTVCAACHGFGTMSAGIFPDLKRAGTLPSKDAWKSVVIDGALEANGMVGFARYMSAHDAEAIRGYVTTLARERQRLGK